MGPSVRNAFKREALAFHLVSILAVSAGEYNHTFYLLGKAECVHTVQLSSYC